MEELSIKEEILMDYELIDPSGIDVFNGSTHQLIETTTEDLQSTEERFIVNLKKDNSHERGKQEPAFKQVRTTKDFGCSPLKSLEKEKAYLQSCHKNVEKPENVVKNNQEVLNIQVDEEITIEDIKEEEPWNEGLNEDEIKDECSEMEIDSMEKQSVGTQTDEDLLKSQHKALLFQNPLLQHSLLPNPISQNTLLSNPILPSPSLRNSSFQKNVLSNSTLPSPLLSNSLLSNPLLPKPLLRNSSFQIPLSLPAMAQQPLLLVALMDPTVANYQKENVSTGKPLDSEKRDKAPYKCRCVNVDTPENNSINDSKIFNLVRKEEIIDEIKTEADPWIEENSTLQNTKEDKLNSYSNYKEFEHPKDPTDLLKNQNEVKTATIDDKTAKFTKKNDQLCRPYESMDQETSLESCCEDVRTSENVINNPEVFNLQNHEEITIEDIKIEEDPCNEDQLSRHFESMEKETTLQSCREDVGTPENVGINNPEVFNLQNHEKIKIEDIKIEEDSCSDDTSSCSEDDQLEEIMEELESSKDKSFLKSTSISLLKRRVIPTLNDFSENDKKKTQEQSTSERMKRDALNSNYRLIEVESPTQKTARTILKSINILKRKDQPVISTINGKIDNLKNKTVKNLCLNCTNKNKDVMNIRITNQQEQVMSERSKKDPNNEKELNNDCGLKELELSKNQSQLKSKIQLKKQKPVVIPPMNDKNEIGKRKMIKTYSKIFTLKGAEKCYSVAKRRLCSVITCNANKRTSLSSLYPFPIHDREVCNAWIRNCGDPRLKSMEDSVLQKKMVCSKHFTEDSFINTPKKRLKENAIPTKICKCGSKENKKEILSERITSEKKIEEKSNNDCNLKELESSKNQSVETLLETVNPLQKQEQAVPIIPDHENYTRKMENYCTCVKAMEDKNVSHPCLKCAKRKESEDLEKCSFVGCHRSRRRDPGLQFFWFPVHFPHLCQKWVIACGIQSLDLISRRVVCEEHFMGNSFKIFVAKQLKKNAIPTECLSLITYSTVKKGDIESISLPEGYIDKSVTLPESCIGIVEKSVFLSERKILEPTSLSTVLPERDIEKPKTLPHTKADKLIPFSAMFKTSDIVSQTSCSVENKGSRIHSNKEKTTSKSQKQKMQMLVLSPHKMLLKSKFKESRKLIKKYQQFSIDSSFIKSEMTAEMLMESTKDLLPETVYNFFCMQVIHTHKKDLPYTETEKQLALSMRIRSPKVYDQMIQDEFALPSPDTLARWLQEVDLRPGFNGHSLHFIRMKAEAMSSVEKNAVLMFDEVSVKPGLDYDCQRDLVEGFVDLGNGRRKPVPAKKILLFMARGLISKWEMPIAFYPVDKICSRTLKKLILACTSTLLSAGVDIRAVVCDHRSTNRSAAVKLNISKSNPYFIYGGRRVYFIFDFPHILKCIGMDFRKTPILTNDGVADWAHVRHLCHSPKCLAKEGSNLSEKPPDSISVKRLERKLESKVFNRKVTSAMKTCIQNEELPNCAKQTFNFLDKVRKVSCSMNSTTVSSANRYKCAISNSKHKYMKKPLKTIENAIEYVQSWLFVNFDRNPPSVDGFELSLKGVKMLWEDLSQENVGYILTGHLRKDPLRNEFSILRTKCGFKNSPTVKKFRQHLCHRLQVGIMTPLTGVNSKCNDNDGKTSEPPQTTTSSQNALTNQNRNEHATGAELEMSRENELDLELKRMTNSLSSPGIQGEIRMLAKYGLEACRQRHHCSMCQKEVTGQKPDHNERKVYEKAEVHNELSDETISVINMVLDVFERHFPKTMCHNAVKKKLLLRSKQWVNKNYPLWLKCGTKCYKHRCTFLDRIIELKIKKTLFEMSKGF